MLLLSDSGTPQLYSLADVHMDILCYALFCFESTAIQETGGCPHIASTPFDDDKTFDSWTSFWWWKEDRVAYFFHDCPNLCLQEAFYLSTQADLLKNDGIWLFPFVKQFPWNTQEAKVMMPLQSDAKTTIVSSSIITCLMNSVSQSCQMLAVIVWQWIW